MASLPEIKSCSIGTFLNEKCKHGNLKDMSDFNDEQQKLLTLRCGLGQILSVCNYHENIFLIKFTSMYGKFCCDPFNKHNKRVKGSLRVITVAQAEQFNLIPGKKLCVQCRLSLSKSEDENISDYMECDFAFMNDEVMKDQLNTSLTSLGCSPIKFVSQNKRLPYGKRKIEEVKKSTEGYVSNLLNIDQDLLRQEPEHCCQDSEDLSHMMELIKEKISATTNVNEKIKLLTLAPTSWTMEKTAEYFSVSIRSVKNARALKKTNGILSNKPNKTGKVLAENTRENVIAFYNDDEFSRMCPGKKEYVSVKINGKRHHIQKRLLLVNLKELHIEFLKRHNDQKIGLSKFCELRPKWCIPVGGASGLHSVCVCEYHQNFKLLASKVPEITDYKELLKKIVCGIENRDCMLRSCDSCPSLDSLRMYLLEVFDAHEIENLSYYQWQKDEKFCSMSQLNSSIEEFADELCKQAKFLCEHQYIKNSQAEYLKFCKSTLSEDSALILLDFAENYSFIVQDAVQGYHWNNSQATLHPFVKGVVHEI